MAFKCRSIVGSPGKCGEVKVLLGGKKNLENRNKVRGREKEEGSGERKPMRSP